MLVRRPLAVALVAFLAPALCAAISHAQGVVPGTGQKLSQVGDDFEDESWDYIFNGAKCSEEQDGQMRPPMGRSTNGRWFEGPKRGHPDVLKRVATPEGGIEGSQGALLMRSLKTGVPGRLSGTTQQDDLILNVVSRIRGQIPVRDAPSCVVRVYLPPFEEWEDRSGPSFGVRTGCYATRTKRTSGLFGFGRSETSREPYWPGIFINFRSETDRRYDEDSAFLTIRAGSRGQDIRGPEITQTGWWTFGISHTPDGAVHYYAKPGVEDLSAEDHISSQHPYSFRCEHFETMFFNVVNRDDGRTWSTSWIVDDPEVYVIRGDRSTASSPRPPRRPPSRSR